MAERLEVLEQLFKAVHRGLHEIMKEALRNRGLPVQSMTVISQVLKSPGITISELARSTGMAKSHVSNMVESLSAMGLLEKCQDSSDQRLVHIYATAKAQTEFKQIRESLRKRFSAAVSALPDEKVEAIIDGLRSLRIAFEQAESGVDGL